MIETGGSVPWLVERIQHVWRDDYFGHLTDLLFKGLFSTLQAAKGDELYWRFVAVIVPDIDQTGVVLATVRTNAAAWLVRKLNDRTASTFALLMDGSVTIETHTGPRPLTWHQCIIVAIYAQVHLFGCCLLQKPSSYPRPQFHIFRGGYTDGD